MSFIKNLSGRSTSTLSSPQGWLSSMFNTTSVAGVKVSADRALKHSTVYSCVNILSESLASLPLGVHERTTKNKKSYSKKASKHPLYSLLHDEPNDDMTSFTWMQVVMMHILLRGNHYSQIVKNNAGKIVAIYPLKPEKMTVLRLDSGKIAYSYSHTTLGTVLLDSSEVLHFLGMTLDGIIGLSPIEYNKNTIGSSIAMEEFGATLFKNGANPSGVVSGTSTKSMSDTAYVRFRKSFEENYQGLVNAGKPLILEDGFTFTPITISNRDGQYLESKKFTKAEIAAIYRIPLHMINELDKATFSNIEHQSMQFVVDAVRPWAVRMEKEIKRKCLNTTEKKSFFIKFNLGALLRGDTKSRYEGYESAITKGCWMTRNEARELEDLNPIDGLDEMIVPLNFGKQGDAVDAKNKTN